MKEAAEKVMKRCQAGTTNYNDANNLHAECYGTIGQLVSEIDRLNACLFQMQNAAIDLASRPWVGLTAEDRESFWTADEMTGEEWEELFSQVEARLKEKNFDRQTTFT